MNGHATYFDDSLTTRTPEGLVVVLLDGALKAIYRSHLAIRAGDTRARSRNVSRALDFVHALALSLDPAPDPVFVARLHGLYATVGQLLLDADAHGRVEPLAACARILANLREGWCRLSAIRNTHSVQN